MPIPIHIDWLFMCPPHSWALNEGVSSAYLACISLSNSGAWQDLGYASSRKEQHKDEEQVKFAAEVGAP